MIATNKMLEVSQMVPRTSTLSSVEKPLSVLHVLRAFSNAECTDGAGG